MRRYTLPNIFAILFFTVALGIFLIGMPKYVDDYWYLEYLRHWFFDQGVMNPENGADLFRVGIPWEEFRQTWEYHYYNDNSRLGNILVVFFLLLPKWIGSGLCLGCWVYAMLRGFRLAGLRLTTSPFIILGVALLGFFMPWRDKLGSLDFQFNYLPPMALAVRVVSLVAKSGADLRHNRKGPHAARNAWAFIAALLCGAWHEGFGLPLLGGLGAVIVFFRGCRRNQALWWAMAGLFIGSAWLLSVPGQWSRLARLEDGSPVATCHILYFLMSTWIYWIMAVWGLIELWRCSGSDEGRRKAARLVFLMVSGFVSAAFVFLIYTDARVGWWAMAAGIFGILYLLNLIWQRRRGNPRSVTGLWLNIALLAVVVAHWVAVDIMVIRIRKAFIEGVEKYIAGPADYTFVNFIDRSKIPVICANMPDVGVFVFGPYGLRKFYKDTLSDDFNFVPYELEGVTSATGHRMPGSAGVREHRGYFYIAEDSLPAGNMTAYRGDRPEYFRVKTTPFISRADGRAYVFLYPYENWINYYFNPVTRIDLEE